MRKTNIGILMGGLLVLFGMCLGWFGLRGFGGGLFITGWQVLAFGRVRGSLYILAYAFPIGAGLAVLTSFIDRRLSALMGMVVGGAFFFWSSIEVLRLLWRTTFLGLWVTVLGALVLLLTGLLTCGRERSF